MLAVNIFPKHREIPSSHLAFVTSSKFEMVTLFFLTLFFRDTDTAPTAGFCLSESR